MSMFGTQANTIRQTCRACRNICFTPEGSPAIGPEGYRCEACETAGYERYDFDKSLPRPEATEPGEATEAAEATDATEQSEATGRMDAVPFDVASAEAASPAAKAEEPLGASPSPDPAASDTSEARPSDEPKSGDGDSTEGDPQGEVVEVTAAPAEAT